MKKAENEAFLLELQAERDAEYQKQQFKQALKKEQERAKKEREKTRKQAFRVIHPLQ